MSQIVKPANESERLRVLKGYRVLDTLPEQVYDDVTQLAAMICETPTALVSLVDDERQWFKSRVGLEASETEREISFCSHAILEPDRTMVVPDATTDPRFADNPVVTGDPEVRFYAGAPLVTPDGYPLGTLCVVDYAPRELAREQLTALEALARQVMGHLELRRAVVRLEREAVVRERYERELEAANTMLTEQSFTDALTGLGNRRAFDERLEQELARAEREGAPTSLFLLDVDRFKDYNDAFGHPAGDEVLRRLSAIVLHVVRRSDFVARYGGEEFAIILPDTTVTGAGILGVRCRRAIEGTEWPHRPVTASLGVATTADSSLAAEELVLRADRALYRAKQAGRNRVATWDEAHDAEA